MSLIGKILTRLFALFGMTLTCVACYGIPEAEFNPEFTASGRVVDSEGQPIEGIRASMGGNNEMNTSTNGRFYVYGNVPRIHLDDVDGEANGGAFESVTIELGESVAELGDITLTRINGEVEENEDQVTE
uniref:hypothetical protein n=1 Tax=Alistipes sp. TaxID=1872444 RepID=UPI004056F288